MGYRAHFAKKYYVEYSDNSHFNNDVEACLELFDKLKIEYYYDEAHEMELQTKDLLELKLEDYKLNEEELEFIQDAIKIAKTAKYCKNEGYLKIHWF
ncbi:hypothetical protein DU472_04465 [Campylobacter novaezeelandiae]|uniref:hypothetical protein n=1 Tax=Campylobacter novaezeelandiae TaxID=2267891 RepID=UPI001037ECF5|nr:hypothetical protein [Campylobacter novaezeelandiae]TBR80916.1 hypothetical protein DU472_04465 [Campylobacter novaezeelandiae]